MKRLSATRAHRRHRRVAAHLLGRGYTVYVDDAWRELTYASHETVAGETFVVLGAGAWRRNVAYDELYFVRFDISR